MINLFRITSVNFDDHLTECSRSINDTKQDFLDTLRDIIKYAPQKSQIISNFLISLIKENPDLKCDITNLISSILSSSDTESVVSALIYCKSLNYKISYFPKLKTMENEYFKDEEIKLDNEIEVNEYFNNIEIFIENLKSGTNFYSDLDEILLFKVVQVIKNYQFDINECLNELDKLCINNEEFIGILYLQDKLDNFYLVSILLRTLNDDKSVENLFRILDKMNKKFRDLLISFIYEYFINRRIYKFNQDIKILFDTKEEIQEIKKYIDEDTVKEMKKYLSIQSLELFVPEYKKVYEMSQIDLIKKEEFDNIIIQNSKKEDLSLKDEFIINDDHFNYKKEFFINFCKLGSPSISHFLTYLEIYKDLFKMSDEDQKIFLEIFNEMFNSRDSFKKIVIGKMVRFKFIKEEFVK